MSKGKEIWKRVPRFPDYEVSSFGRVRRLTTRTCTTAGRILKPALHYSGYFHHGLVCNGKMTTIRLNRLVCEAFYGPAPSKKHQAAHRDGNRRNDRADNLRWATVYENEADKVRHGTRRRGTAVHWAKLTEGIVADIRRRAIREELDIDALADEYRVSPGLIRHIICYRAWPHVKVA